MASGMICRDNDEYGLNFLPLPQAQASSRPILGAARRIGGIERTRLADG
jgi:hypothetical protein